MAWTVLGSRRRGRPGGRGYRLLVVAGGVLVARDQRRRNSYTPEDIRSRLHQRLAEAGEAKD